MSLLPVSVGTILRPRREYEVYALWGGRRVRLHANDICIVIDHAPPDVWSGGYVAIMTPGGLIHWEFPAISSRYVLATYFYIESVDG